MLWLRFQVFWHVTPYRWASSFRYFGTWRSIVGQAVSAVSKKSSCAFIQEEHLRSSWNVWSLKTEAPLSFKTAVISHPTKQHNIPQHLNRKNQTLSTSFGVQLYLHPLPRLRVIYCHGDKVSGIKNAHSVHWHNTKFGIRWTSVVIPALRSFLVCLCNCKHRM